MVKDPHSLQIDPSLGKPAVKSDIRHPVRLDLRNSEELPVPKNEENSTNLVMTYFNYIL